MAPCPWRPVELSTPQHPGEIFLILRDSVSTDETVEVAFTSRDTCVRVRPTVWARSVWCMPAVDFPAGLVTVDVYSDRTLVATTEMTYYTVDRVRGAARLADTVCRVSRAVGQKDGKKGGDSPPHCLFSESRQTVGG